MIKETASLRTRHLAERLLASETIQSSEQNTPGVFLVLEKLRRPLSSLAGATGFRALLARALTLARARVPSLRSIEVKADGSLEMVGKANDGGSPEAGVILVAQLLDLLVAFIGEDLTLRLVSSLWPEVAVPSIEHYREH